jgi:uncharacterized protein YlaI
MLAGTMMELLMIDDGFIIRKAERKAYCRGCDKTISVGEDVFYTYSFRNRGQNILICLDCFDDMTNKHQKFKEEQND